MSADSTLDKSNHAGYGIAQNHLMMALLDFLSVDFGLVMILLLIWSQLNNEL